MRGVLISVIAASIIVSACGQADELAIQTRVAQTLEVRASDPEQPSIAPPTTEPSPTPDARVINVDPETLLLAKSDLPQDARYYIPYPEWRSPHRNKEVLSGFGVEEGREYLARTGRVDGWFIQLQRGTSTVLAPEYVYDNVVLYSTAEGAVYVMTEFGGCSDPENDYQLVATEFQLGDLTNSCEWHEMQSGGENYVHYRIEFLYKNVYHAIEIMGWEYEIDPKYAEAIATTLYEKLLEAPLSSEVTYSP